MNVVNTMENEVQVLELVSETENQESEHEEGEISEDDEDDDGETSSSCFLPSPPHHSHHHYPQHFSYPPDFAPERRLPKKSSPVTSEVVIYDDHGRTAIFTSPKKKKKKSGRELTDYPRVPDGVRRWSRDDSSKRREKDEVNSKSQKDADKSRRRQSETTEPSVKKRSKRKLQAVKKVREDVIDLEKDTPENYQMNKKAPHNSPRRKRSPSSTDNSNPSSSCSDSDESSSRPQRGRGKENKRSHSLGKSHARSPPRFGVTRLPSQSCSSSRQHPTPLHKSHSQKSSGKSTLPQNSPPPQKKDLYRKSPLSHSCYKSSKDLNKNKTSLQSQYRPLTKPRKTSLNKSNKISDMKAMVKIKSSKGKTHDIPLMKGQKQPPPGSLGEMLLKKTMKGKLKVRPEVGESDGLTTNMEKRDAKASENNKEDHNEDLPSELVVPECYTLDQEDEDELQLRLIALQSSLRVLSDVRKEGQQEKMAWGLSVAEKSSHLQNNPEERGESSSIENFNLLQSSGNKFPFSITLQNSLQQQKTSALEYMNQVTSNGKTGFGLEENSIEDIEALLEKSSLSSVRSVATTPDSEECEIVMESIDTNKSYLNVRENSSHLIGNREELQRDMKEPSDCNQDPVDMDICDSSPGEEEEEDDTVEEVSQDVGEDISLSNVEPQDTTAVSENLLNSSNDVKENSCSGSEVPPQIPVEWAYMMPPPPPPDQPANDLSNINNWCYDQNMYLQTMQAQYDSNNPQYSLYGLQGVNNADWLGEQQSQSPQWRCSVNEDHQSDMKAGEDERPPMPSTPQQFDRNDMSKMEENFDANSDSTEGQKDLKDMPAEQYQAFMSVVLKQQTAQPKHPSTNDMLQRNLIEVPLVKDTGNCLSHKCDTKHLSVKKQVSTRKSHNILIARREAKRRKRMKQKKRKSIKLAKRLAAEAATSNEVEPVTEDIKTGKTESVPEEEDEDLLRAKLLIDLSKKKQQKAVCSAVEKKVLVTAEASRYTGMQKNADKKFAVGVMEMGGSSPQHNLPLSSDSSPVAKLHTNRTVLLKKLHKRPSRVKEGSPTQMFRMDMRKGLSDIGGFGLDPKSSRYDYPIPHDHLTHSDVPKFKFPPVKPVIISLHSDSEDESEENKVTNLTSSQDTKKEAEPEASTSGPYSSSIDILLKSVRNAMPSSEDSRGVQEKPGPSGKRSLSGLPLKPTVTHKDLTPNVVRHLSRTQQEEYRWLKEQLRQKELICRRRQLQQQKPSLITRTKPVASCIDPSSPAVSDDADEGSRPSIAGGVSASHDGCKYNDKNSSGLVRESHPQLPQSEVRILSAASFSGGLSCSREVSLKEMGRLQIQLSNVTTCENSGVTTNVEKAGERGKDERQSEVNAVTDESSQRMSGAEDEDEETLRMMVFQTLQKKLSGRAATNEELPQNGITNMYIADDTEESQSAETRKVVICQKIDENIAGKKKEKEDPTPSQQHGTRKVVFEEVDETVETGKHKSNNREEQQQEEEMVGEWMVLDEVTGEECEGNAAVSNSDGEESEQYHKFGSTKTREETDREDKRERVLESLQTSEESGCTSFKTRAMIAGTASLRLRECEQIAGRLVKDSCISQLEVEEKNTNIQSGDSLAEAFYQERGDVTEEGLVSKKGVCQETNLNGVEQIGIENTCEENIITKKFQKEDINCVNNQTLDKTEKEIIAGSDEVLEAPSKFITVKGRETQRQDGKNSTQRDAGYSRLTEESLAGDVNSSVSVVHSNFNSDTDESETYKGSKPVTSKDPGPSVAKCDQNLLLEPPLEKPQVLVSNALNEQGQLKGRTLTEDYRMNRKTEKIKEPCKNINQSEQELKKDKTAMQESLPKKLLAEPKGHKKNLTREAHSTSLKITAKDNKGVSQRKVSSNYSIQAVSQPADGESSFVNSLLNVSSKAETRDLLMAPGKGTNQENKEKPVKTKRLMLLEQVEHEYSEKRLGLNKLITQLASLLQEATEEEQQRQTLKKSVMQLRAQLKEMEVQLETKSSVLKTKMACIRELQTKITSDRQLINELKQKGEHLGRKVVGSSYTLPKGLESPHSKNKDTFKKKLLASNIDALRQQMRDVSNRSRARLQVAALKADNQGSTGRDKTPNENLGKESDPGQETVLRNPPLGSHVIATQGNVKTAVKNLFQVKTTENGMNQRDFKGISSKSKGGSENNTKRKVAPASDWGARKVAKTEDRRDDSSILRQRMTTCAENESTTAVGPGRLEERTVSRENAVHKIEDGEKLDEMNELCPYDLLGRCNDDSCTYQHFAQPRNGSRSMMKPAASLTAKAGEQSLKSGPKTGTEPDVGGTGVTGPDTGTKRMGSDTGKMRTGSDNRIGQMKPVSGMGTRGPDHDMGKSGTGTGMRKTRPDFGTGQVELDVGYGRIGPDTGTERAGADSQTGKKGPKTEMGEMEKTLDPNILPSKIDDSGCGDSVGDNLIPLDFRIENKCAFTREDRVKSSVLHNTNASSCLKNNIVFMNFSKKEDPSMSGAVNLIKTDKRLRDNKEDSPLGNSGMCVSNKMADDDTKRARVSTGEPTTTSACGVHSNKEEELRDVSESSRTSQEQKVDTNEVDSKTLVSSDKYIESKIESDDGISEVTAVMKLSVERSAGGGETDQYMETDSGHIGEDCKNVSLGYISAPTVAKSELKGQMQLDDSQEKVFLETLEEEGKNQKDKNNDDVSICHSNLYQIHNVFGKTLHGHTQEQVLQTDEDHSENLLEAECEKKKDESVEANVHGTVVDCNTNDVTRARRPVTRKKSQVSSNEKPDNPILTRCRRTKASGEQRRGRSRTMADKLPKDSQSNCIESSGVKRCGLKRKAKQKKKDQRSSASRGRKKV